MQELAIYSVAFYLLVWGGLCITMAAVVLWAPKYDLPLYVSIPALLLVIAVVLFISFNLVEQLPFRIF